MVGGGPAALSAARGYRDAGGRGSVTLLTDDDRPPYERPPLSKAVLRGDRGADEAPLLETEDDLARRGIHVRTGAAVTAVDRDAREVRLAGAEPVPYDGLVLATGAEPVRPDVPGVGAAHVHVLRTARDAAGLVAVTAAGTAVAVIGTGFIGCEAAAALAQRGARVTLAGQEPQPLAARIGPRAGARIGAWLDDAGVQRRHGVALDAVQDGVCTLSGETVAADVVLLVCGIAPRTGLAADAGLPLALDDTRVAAGVGQRTADPHVLAAGDCSATEHPVAGRPLVAEHWGDALAQGEAAGRRLAGDASARWDVVPGFWSEIGDRQLKHRAWGDGWADERHVEHPGGGWTVWYADTAGRCVGVLAHDRDADYERGGELIAAGAPCPG